MSSTISLNETGCNTGDGTASAASGPSKEPKGRQEQGRQDGRISILPQDVVDKIAAGEVVQRPVSVIKELIENALDADARNIQVHIEHSCLNKMTVTDDGVGIRKSDLPLLATRHATSKLSTTDDFETLATFGFRGEALAATSTVSRMTVITKRRPGQQEDQQQVGGNNHLNEDEDATSSTIGNVAYTQTYENGRPTQPRPKPCARSKPGTTIVVQDLFYNVAHRRRAYENRDSEEYNKILTVVQQYAVHYPSVGFVCQRTRSSSSSSSSSKSKMTARGSRGMGGAGGKPIHMVDCNTTQLRSVQEASAAIRRNKEQKKAALTTMDVHDDDYDDGIKAKIIDATKEVVSHVMGTNIGPQLSYLECSSNSTQPLSSLSSSNSDDNFLSQTNGNYDASAATDTTGAQTSKTLLSPTPKAKVQNDLRQRHQFQYSAEIYFTPPFYESKIAASNNNSGSKASRFILFLNDRIVDLHPLKRALEDVYAQLQGQSESWSSQRQQNIQTKPVLVVSIRVPGWQVDVNVHPSKQRVSLVYEDELIEALSQALRKRLEQEGRLFSSANTQSVPSLDQKKAQGEERIIQDSNKNVATSRPVHNPASIKEPTKRGSEGPDSDDEDGEMDDNDDDDDDHAKSSDEAMMKKGGKAGSKRQNVSLPSPQSSSAKKSRVYPSQVIRTSKAAPTGALEPYLIRKRSSQSSSQYSSQSQSQQQNSSSFGQINATQAEETESTDQPHFNNAVVTPTTRFIHLPGCPLLSSAESKKLDDVLDMTQPGAFAKALQNERCTCPRDDEARRAIMVKQTVIIRPKKVIPTECQYTSIEELRKRIYKRIDKDVLNHLREAQFIGCVSDQRSLIQCGQHLVLINHMEMAKDLFYQLALLRFRGGAPIARLGIADESGGIQIETAIAHAFEIEDRLNSLDGRGDLELMKEKSSPSEEGSTYLMEISNTNRAMARQATSFLLEKAEMLEQYFSIRIESRRSLNNTPRTERLGEDKKGEIDDDETEAYLTGLPELLEGHCPCLHGLPVFLLRLATQVDWNEEKPCFHGISREVGSYYAMMPLSAEDPDEDKGFDGDDICSGSAMAMNISNTPSSSSSSYVQHQIFPALSHLLLPPKRLSREGYFAIQTNLSELYKMFQR